MSQENQDLKRLVYTSHEKEFLKELVLKYKCIVENKRTDGATLQQKQKAWNEIESEYNAVTDHNKRTSKQLKKLWDNLKTEKKKQLASLKRETLSTGGGPPPKAPKEDPCDSILNNTFATEIEGALDSDTVALSQVGRGDFIVADNSTLQPATCYNEFENGVGEMMEDDGILPLTTCIIEESADISSPRLPVSGNVPDKLSPRQRSVTYKSRGAQRESDERVKRVKGMMQHDKEIHALIVEELKYKVAVAKLTLQAKEEEMKRAAESHAEEMAFKRKKWELELQLYSREH